MSLVKSLFHIVISTKNRQMTITEEHKRLLFAYIHGLIKNQNSTLLRLNGIPNHLHMLVDLSTEISLSDFMRELKRSTSIWLKEHPQHFPYFRGWGKEYYAFSCSAADVMSIVDYIKAQEAHHKLVKFENEIETIAINNRTTFYLYD